MKLRLMSAAMLLLSSYPVYAADNSAPIDPVIVTATRTAQTVNETFAAVIHTALTALNKHNVASAISR